MIKPFLDYFKPALPAYGNLIYKPLARFDIRFPYDGYELNIEHLEVRSVHGTEFIGVVFSFDGRLKYISASELEILQHLRVYTMREVEIDRSIAT